MQVEKSSLLELQVTDVDNLPVFDLTKCYLVFLKEETRDVLWDAE
jgi:hypothetical protein